MEHKMGLDSKTTFTNPDRTRYYGKRIGDIVRNTFEQHSNYGQHLEVVDWGFGNNSLFVRPRMSDAAPHEHVAEWLEIVTRVEDLDGRDLSVTLGIRDGDVVVDAFDDFGKGEMVVKRVDPWSDRALCSRPGGSGEWSVAIEHLNVVRTIDGTPFVNTKKRRTFAGLTQVPLSEVLEEGAKEDEHLIAGLTDDERATLSELLPKLSRWKGNVTRTLFMWQCTGHEKTLSGLAKKGLLRKRRKEFDFLTPPSDIAKALNVTIP
jgi:hypothetical protein